MEPPEAEPHPPAVDGRSPRWWPAFRRIDGIGVALLLAFLAWVWWVSRAQGGDAGPSILLLLAAGVVAVLARWATFFHGTGAPALIVAGMVVYAIVTGDLPPGLGPEGSVEAAGALFATATGTAALVSVRARSLWPSLIFGLLMVGFAVLTWRTGSLWATAIAATVVLSAIALLALPMQERRWVVVWPAFVAGLVLFGTLTYASLPLPGGLFFGQPEASRVAAWRAGLDAVTGSPLYGTGVGVAATAADDSAGAHGWVRHEPLEVAAETGLVGGLLLLALVWWTVSWVARPGGGPGSVVAGVVIAGSIAHACLEAIWHVPAVPLTLAALAGTASMRGGDAAWRLEALWERVADDVETA